MAKTKKVADSAESAPAVKQVKEITNPCDSCPKTYDKKNPFCKTCVNYRG
jgi:hypothetical protein